MRPLLFHPSRRALQSWLNSETTDEPKLDDHVAVCQKCANTIERLDANGDRDIATALALVLQPPEDLSTRLEKGVSARLDSRVMFGVLSDMFAAGLETSRMLILDENGVDDE